MRRKPANQSKQIHKNWVIASITGLILFGAFIFSRSTNDANINYVGNEPAPTSITIAPTTCVSRVKTATVSLPCSTQGFLKVSYQCNDGRSFIVGDGKKCVDIFSAGYEARDKCGTTCINPSAPPSPRVCRVETGSCVTTQNTCLTYNDSCAKEDFCAFPIKLCASPSPVPSPSPLSMFSCKVRVFQLKPEDKLDRPMTFATPDREINPSSHQVKPGDRYAYLIESTSNLYSTTVATVSGHTSNLHGFDEPILVQSTSPDCSSNDDKKDKFLECTLPSTSYTAKIPKLLDLGMVVQIQDSVKDLKNTSTEFTVNNLHYGNYQMSKCSVMMLADQSTPTPTPSSYFTCIYQCVVKSRQSIAACREICKK